MSVLFALLIALSTGDAQAAPAQKIRVRLAESAEKVRVRGFDLKMAAPRVDHRFDKLTEWELICAKGNLVAKGRERSFVVTLGNKPLSITTPAGFLSAMSRPYREEIQVYSGKKGCEVINVVDVEEYLDGLVNSEFSAKWSEEAIAAQVVAARTYAFHKIREARRKAGARYDVESTTRDQVYDGILREDYRASRVVDRTRGMVLEAKGARGPLKAYYHSTCGGSTELPEHVWGGREAGFKQPVRCPYCASSPRFNWELTLTAEEIAAAILKSDGRKSWPKDWRQKLPRAKLENLLVVRVDGGGRAEDVATIWRVGPGRLELKMPAARLREWVGPTRLRSTAFEVRPFKPSEWRIAGRGNGHGVGMCQWGAKTMGEKGFNMASILRFYYPDALLRKAW